MEKPHIYCQDAEKVYQVYGIPASRAQKLHSILADITKKWEGKNYKVSVILNEVWDYCNTNEELVYMTYVLGMSIGEAEGSSKAFMLIPPPVFNQPVNNN